MTGLRRLWNRRTLAHATDPAAWRALMEEQAWQLRGPCRPADETLQLARVPFRVYWPTRYRHPSALNFVRPLREGLATLGTLEPRAIPQPYDGIVMLGVGYQERTVPIAVDYYDYTFVNDDCLKQVPIYFKMQHRRAGYSDPKIVPGGYVAGRRSLYDYY